MDKVSDYGSEDSRFESWRGRSSFKKNLEYTDPCHALVYVPVTLNITDLNLVLVTNYTSLVRVRCHYHIEKKSSFLLNLCF